MRKVKVRMSGLYLHLRVAGFSRKFSAASVEDEGTAKTYAAAAAARTTGFSTIGRCSSAETMPNAIDPHQIGS